MSGGFHTDDCLQSSPASASNAKSPARSAGEPGGRQRGEGHLHCVCTDCQEEDGGCAECAACLSDGADRVGGVKDYVLALEASERALADAETRRRGFRVGRLLRVCLRDGRWPDERECAIALRRRYAAAPRRGLGPLWRESDT